MGYGAKALGKLPVPTAVREKRAFREHCVTFLQQQSAGDCPRVSWYLDITRQRRLRGWRVGLQLYQKANANHRRSKYRHKERQDDTA